MKGDGFSPDEHRMLSSLQPGGQDDYLLETDPARELRNRTVHWDCYAAWPERERVVTAYLDWMVRNSLELPELAVARRSPHLLVLVSARSNRRDGLTIICADSGETRNILITTPWEESLDHLEAEAARAHPFPRAGLDRAVETLRSFPTFESVVDAVDWTLKPTRCAICERPLGLAPSAEEAYRLPSVAAWPPSAPLGSYQGRLVHTSCYVGWKERPRFAATLADADLRLSKPTPKGCAYADERVRILLEKEIHWRDAELRLLETGTRLSCRAIKWAEWSADPEAFHPRLRAFERTILAEILPGLRARFPTAEALAAAVDWTRKEAEYQEARAALAEACRRLEGQVRCPSCAGALQLVQGPRFSCGTCAITCAPLDVGWFPE